MPYLLAIPGVAERLVQTFEPTGWPEHQRQLLIRHRFRVPAGLGGYWPDPGEDAVDVCANGDGDSVPSVARETIPSASLVLPESSLGKQRFLLPAAPLMVMAEREDKHNVLHTFFTDNYQDLVLVDKVLGRGNHGAVFQVQLRKWADGERGRFALKMVRIYIPLTAKARLICDSTP